MAFAIFLVGIVVFFLLAAFRRLRMIVPGLNSPNSAVVLVVWIGLLVGWVVLSVALFNNSGTTSIPQSVAYAPPVPTGPSVATPFKTATSAPTKPAMKPTATPESIAIIPGFTAADLKLPLQDKGFTCETRNGEQLMSWICEKDMPVNDTQIVVEMFGSGPTRIHWLTATVFQYSATPNDADAADWLGVIATLPYEGATPTTARAWVESNITQQQSKMFGRVEYRLYGLSTARILQIVGKAAQ